MLHAVHCIILRLERKTKDHRDTITEVLIARGH